MQLDTVCGMGERNASRAIDWPKSVSSIWEHQEMVCTARKLLRKFIAKVIFAMKLLYWRSTILKWWNLQKYPRRPWGTGGCPLRPQSGVVSVRSSLIWLLKKSLWAFWPSCWLFLFSISIPGSTGLTLDWLKEAWICYTSNIWMWFSTLSPSFSIIGLIVEKVFASFPPCLHVTRSYLCGPSHCITHLRHWTHTCHSFF